MYFSVIFAIELRVLRQSTILYNPIILCSKICVAAAMLHRALGEKEHAVRYRKRWPTCHSARGLVRNPKSNKSSSKVVQAYLRSVNLGRKGENKDISSCN